MVSSYRVILLTLLGTLAVAKFLAAGEATPSSYVIETIAGIDNAGDGGSALMAGLIQPEGIAVDRSGNVYVADAAGHRVYKIAPGGSIETIAGTGIAGFAGDGGPASAALLNQPYGLALDKSGNLYIADLGNARVRKVALDGSIHTVAGGGAFPAAGMGQGGPATSVQLVEPRNIAVDAAADLWIADFGANQVYEVGSNGTLSLVAGTGQAGFSGGGTSAMLAQLNAPAGLAIDSNGALYIADSGNSRVRKVSGGMIITVFTTPAPTGVAVDSSGMLYVAASNYLGTVAQQIPGIASAQDVALDQAGNVYFTSGPFVFEIGPSGTAKVIAGSGASPSFGGDGGPASAARLNSPSGIAVVAGDSSTGNWFITDTANNRIRMVSPSGVIRTVAGTGDAGSAGDNGPATLAQLNAPRGIAVDGSGNLYFADSGNDEVRKITAGGVISSIATQLNKPVSVALDGQGSVYIADSGNNRVVQVTTVGAVNTFAKIESPLTVGVDASGTVFVAGATEIWKIASDGTTTSVVKGLNSPGGLAFDASGTLFIADTGANVVRRVSPAGVLSTIAGTGTAGFSGDGGPAVNASLNAPAGIAIGAGGMLLVADSANNRIRTLTPSSSTPETAPVGIVNAASLAGGPIAPGEIVTVFGSGFDETKTQLLFDGNPATLFYTGKTQINARAPAGLVANSNTKVGVVVNGVEVAATSVPVVAAAPGIFTIAGANGQAAAVNQDGSINSESNPAARGSVVLLYATGQGVDNAEVTVTIAGYNATLLYAGPAPGFPGLMQMNAQIPTGFLPPGIQAVLLTVGSAASQSGVTLAIE